MLRTYTLILPLKDSGLKKNGGLKLEQKREGYQVKLHNLSLSQKVIFSLEIFFNLDF